MYYQRKIDNYLLSWKDDPYRKPLLIRGARQVGKSSAVRHLGETFNHFIEINLERDQDIKQLFGANIDVKKICIQLSAIKGIPIVPRQTLLFIDEIQESPRAISALRYFYEEYPELHVVAAGSLLEFTLRDIPSFGVGRISSIYMYPFSFDEFLIASGDGMLESYKKNYGNYDHPLPAAMHSGLCEKLRTYYLVGGMPESVARWIETSDYSGCAAIQRDIISTYQDDFGKYNSRISSLALRNTLMSVARQAGCKFVYSMVEGDNGTTTVKKALQLLTLAGLVIPVIHTAANGIPLGAETNSKFIKYLILDTGLMQALLRIPPADISLSSSSDFVNKGAFSEVFAGLELLKYSSPYDQPQLYYWQRLSKGSQAEVDYVTTDNTSRILPIEVKAGTRGSMQSMRIFMELKHLDSGIRVCMENFGRVNEISICPLYAISHIQRE